jgi:hypothetical protein
MRFHLPTVSSFVSILVLNISNALFQLLLLPILINHSSAENMGAYLMDHFIERERVAALVTICRAYVLMMQWDLMNYIPILLIDIVPISRLYFWHKTTYSDRSTKVLWSFWKRDERKIKTKNSIYILWDWDFKNKN